MSGFQKRKGSKPATILGLQSLNTIMERIPNMRQFLFKATLLSLSLLLSATFAHADNQRVIKVFIMKARKSTQTQSQLNLHSTLKNVEIDLPTDAEMKAAYQALDSMGIDRDHLPKDDQPVLMEMFMFKVQTAPAGQGGEKVMEVNGVPVEKATDDDLVKERELLEGLKDIKDFFRHFEFQFGWGGAFPLSNNLALSYHDPASYTLGIGYQLSRQFSLLLNVDSNSFNSGNDVRTQGFNLTEGTVELLAKYRFSTDGIRPYIFAGPAFGFSQFESNYSNSSSFNGLGVSNTGNTTLSDNGHFAAVAGLGFEVPLATFHAFLQAEAIDDFIGSNVSNFATLDRPIVFLPIEVGLVFGQ